MTKANKKSVYRITLDFSEDSRDYVEKLQSLTNCNTKAELFKQALNVLDFVCSELALGRRFVVEDDDEKREVVFPLMISRANRT